MQVKKGRWFRAIFVAMVPKESYISGTATLEILNNRILEYMHLWGDVKIHEDKILMSLTDGNSYVFFRKDAHKFLSTNCDKVILQKTYDEIHSQRIDTGFINKNLDGW